MMRKVLTLLVAGIMATGLSGCEAAIERSDAKYVAKYETAMASVENVESVEVEYRTHAGMGRTGHIYLEVDGTDRDLMKQVLRDAVHKLVEVGRDDPTISLPIQVVGSDERTVIGPSSVGIEGTLIISTYAKYVDCDGPEGSCTQVGKPRTQ